MINLHKRDLLKVFQIEKWNLVKPRNTPIVIFGETPLHPKSLASYLLLKQFYKKAEKGLNTFSSRDFDYMKKEANLRGYTCPYCKGHFFEDASIDHKIPYYFGGTNIYSNIQITCADCNHSKGALDKIKTPKAFSLFKEKMGNGEKISCLNIINESLKSLPLSKKEIKQLKKLKIKEEEWREKYL